MNEITIKRMDYDFTICKVTDYSLVKEIQSIALSENGRRKFAGMFYKRCAAECHQKR